MKWLDQESMANPDITLLEDAMNAIHFVVQAVPDENMDMRAVRAHLHVAILFALDGKATMMDANDKEIEFKSWWKLRKAIKRTLATHHGVSIVEEADETGEAPFVSQMTE